MDHLCLGFIKDQKGQVAIEPLVCIQGGGAKGGWQAGVLEALLDKSYIKPVAAYGSSAGAINSFLLSQNLA